MTSSLPEVPRVGSLPPDVDDVTRPVQDDERGSVYENVLTDLEKALSAEVQQEPVTLMVSKRPGVSIRYSTELDDEKLTAWRKRATDRRRQDEFNSLRFCLIILANTCEAIRMGGKDARDSEGQLLTFRHRDIRRMLKLGDHVQITEVARALIGNDAHVMTHANEVLDAAGFGDAAVEVEDGEEGPTSAG